MTRFTIITCTYNAQDTLQRTLESVLRQTYEGVEHLIVDGLSPDNSAQMAREYANLSAEKTQHIVTVKSEKDRGLYDAMNKGISLATGDYVLFLNAGDVFPTDNTLSNIARKIGDVPKEKLPGVLYGDTDIVDDDGHFLRHRRLSPPKKLTWHSFKHGMLVCHQAFYARTDIAKSTPYNLKYRYSADVDWCIRIMKETEKHGLTLLNLQQIVANYLDGGLTIKHHRASLRERFKVMSGHYGALTAILMHLLFTVRMAFKK